MKLITKIALIEQIPERVWDTLQIHVNEISACGNDGGETTSDAIEQLEEYQRRLENA